MSFVRDIIITIIIAILIFFCLQVTVANLEVFGICMRPNVEHGDRILVNKITYRFIEPERGDVIVFKPPFNETKNYIKRVIGLPGEAVEIVNGITYVYTIDGDKLTLDEPYESEPSTRDSAKKFIPEGQYYVMGDNRNNSNDSRSGWLVPEENIVGKAWLSIWPPDRWGMALHYPFPESMAQASD